jgi:hypothetical protein
MKRLYPLALGLLLVAGVAHGDGISGGGSTAPKASKSDEQTGTSAVVVTTPSQQQQHDSAAKAWVNFSGSGTNGAQTINASYNVSAVSRTALGNYTVTISPTPFASTSFVCNVTAMITGTNGWGEVAATGLTVSNIPVNFITSTGSSLAAFDPVQGMIVCFGRQ